jgi:hypothetical protein
MTIEELTDYLNDLLEKHPESKTSEVKIQYWDKDETFDDYNEYIAYDPVLDVEYDTDKKILVIEGETI